MSTPPTPPVVTAWIEALLSRHTRPFTKPEFLKAVRALSARYVERRADLPRRSPIDSAGKRAAFAAFFAPMHLLTALAVIEALGDAVPPVDQIIDVGCGTGVASAAWALAQGGRPRLSGVDQDGWSMTEAQWNWRTLRLSGRTRRGNMADLDVLSAERLRGDSNRTGIVFGWSLNELVEADRRPLLPALLARAERGAVVLILEPLAKTAVPWWEQWAREVTAAGGRADEWKLQVSVPLALRQLDESAGFRREALTARSLLIATR